MTLIITFRNDLEANQQSLNKFLFILFDPEINKKKIKLKNVILFAEMLVVPHLMDSKKKMCRFAIMGRALNVFLDPFHFHFLSRILPVLSK